ncbi:uncharacterized protein LTR77_008860 [Saxophila tyrrhenica]|uniref:Uncharacterized protein n=1 Tax=Saxophila tyrrhenica TaxID=1690608 RepID=A0AAV9P0W3_9PEZI|nr:hypothetical protein LTR77_008860 [Saxophila tyrrhenica]
MAWVPQGDRYVPFANTSRATNRTATNGTNGSSTATILPPPMLGDHLSFGRPATLMLAVMPGLFSNSVEMPSHIIPAGCAWQSSSYSGFSEVVLSDATFIECQVFNTSLSAKFEYVNGGQQVVVTRNQKPDDLPLLPIEQVTGPMNPTNGGNDFQIGLDEIKNASCSTLNLSGEQCLFQPEVLRVWSYQAVVDAFNRLVQGTIGLDTSSISPGIDPQTNLLGTILQNSNELAFLQGYDIRADSTIPSLSALVDASLGSEYEGLFNNATILDHLPLATALEKLFQNITISLLSDKILQPNPTSAYAPPLEADVTTTRTHNIYIYAARTLWLAYGIAIAFTLLSVVAGTVALVLNGASFSNDFSTIVRVSRVAMLSEEVTQSDGDGTEPLPRHLKDSRLSMKRAQEGKGVLLESVPWGEGKHMAQETYMLTTRGGESRAGGSWFT